MEGPFEADEGSEVMRRSTIVTTALAVCVGALGVLSSGHAEAAGRRGRGKPAPKVIEVKPKLGDLKQEFSRLERSAPGVAIDKKARLDVLAEILELGELAAVQFLIEVAENHAHEDLRGDLLTMLASKGPESEVIAGLFRRHFVAGDAFRGLARDYLLARAVRLRDELWLRTMFRTATVEDRFFALHALGRLASQYVIEAADALLHDPSWKPDGGELIGCATLARSLRDHEGEEAARLLLLLKQDPRFTELDGEALLDATRTWDRSDLLSYVDVSSLASSDVNRRLSSVLFMGRARIEMARQPLLRMALDEREDVSVRAAAAASLGSLRIARGDLARQLESLLKHEQREVRLGALVGLGRLEVRQAAELLVTRLGGPLDRAVRQALSDCTGMSPATNFLRFDLSTLPEGT
jgi:HEAT repeat protein